MLFIKAIILAIIQGVTEFIPVSSSGHLVLLHHYLSLNNVNELMFDVSLHLGTTFALIIYFRQDILKYLKAFGSMFRGVNLADPEQKTVINIVLATIPAVLAGFFLESYFENFFRNVSVVAIALIIGGFLFFIVDKFAKQQLKYENLSLPKSFLIGCAQALALIPGVSRSGITIIAGMTAKLNRYEAAKFSFLLSIPIILGAGLKTFLDIDFSTIVKQEIYLVLIGILVSLIIGYLVIKYFLKYLQTKNLTVFGIYRIVLGVILLIFVYWI